MFMHHFQTCTFHVSLVCFVNPNRYSEGNPGNCNTLNALMFVLLNHFVYESVLCVKNIYSDTIGY